MSLWQDNRRLTAKSESQVFAMMLINSNNDNLSHTISKIFKKSTPLDHMSKNKKWVRSSCQPKLQC